MIKLIQTNYNYNKNSLQLQFSSVGSKVCLIQSQLKTVYTETLSNLSV